MSIPAQLLLNKANHFYGIMKAEKNPDMHYVAYEDWPRIYSDQVKSVINVMADEFDRQQKEIDLLKKEIEKLKKKK